MVGHGAKLMLTANVPWLESIPALGASNSPKVPSGYRTSPLQWSVKPNFTKKASDSPAGVIDGVGGGTVAHTLDGIRLIRGGDGAVRGPHEAMMAAGRIEVIPGDHLSGVD